MKKLLLILCCLGFAVGCSGVKTELENQTIYVTNNEEYNVYNEIIIPVEENMDSIHYIYMYDSSASDFVNGYPVKQQNLAEDIIWFIEAYKADTKVELSDKEEGRMLYTILYEKDGKVYSIDGELLFDYSTSIKISEEYPKEFVEELREGLDTLVNKYEKSDKAEIQDLKHIREVFESDNSLEKEEKNLVKKIEEKK